MRLGGVGGAEGVLEGPGGGKCSLGGLQGGFGIPGCPRGTCPPLPTGAAAPGVPQGRQPRLPPVLVLGRRGSGGRRLHHHQGQPHLGAAG